jgi:hypothetical protein
MTLLIRATLGLQTAQNTQTSHAAVEGAATAIARASTRKHPPAPPRRRRVRQQFRCTLQRAPRAVARERRVLYELKLHPATLLTQRLFHQELPTIGRDFGRRQAGRCGRANHCGVLRAHTVACVQVDVGGATLNRGGLHVTGRAIAVGEYDDGICGGNACEGGGVVEEEEL